MSCCEGSGKIERYPGTGCCGSSCAAETTGCLANEPRIRSCLCQKNVGCLDRADCGGFRPSGTAATGACPGPCQCAEEEAWNCNVPPKPNCEWLNNFTELRRQWSNHGRQWNCKCCNCRTYRTAAPCRPCLPTKTKRSCHALPRANCKKCCRDNRLSGGSCDSQGSIMDNMEEDESSTVDRESGGGCGTVNHDDEAQCRSECCTSHGVTANCCQPCASPPKSILKKRSCCQCITGYCMCQPMPRSCNCPPPVQIDARAERECSCDCPSSPECACPPSERRFPRTKVKCPNARLCYPLPRLPPGPKCHCTQCQPCLPPPCDHCTSSKCRTIVPRARPCRVDSPCSAHSPCRPNSQSSAESRFAPCQTDPLCTSCRKMVACSRNKPCGTPDRSCSPVCRGPGQSVSPWITVTEATGDVGGCEGLGSIDENEGALCSCENSGDESCGNCNYRSSTDCAMSRIKSVNSCDSLCAAADTNLNVCCGEGRAEVTRSSASKAVETLPETSMANTRARESRGSRDRSPSSERRGMVLLINKPQSNLMAAIARAKSPQSGKSKKTFVRANNFFQHTTQNQENRNCEYKGASTHCISSRVVSQESEASAFNCRNSVSTKQFVNANKCSNAVNESECSTSNEKGTSPQVSPDDPLQQTRKHSSPTRRSQIVSGVARITKQILSPIRGSISRISDVRYEPPRIE